MFRVWAKIMKGSHKLDDYVAENDDRSKNLTLRLYDCVDDICQYFDLAKPIWLDQNYDELNKFGKTAFRQDHFIEQISFQELEIEIIEYDEEEKKK